MPETVALERKIDDLTTALTDFRSRFNELDALTEAVKDIKGTLSEVNERLDAHSDDIHSLLQWRDSSVGTGAEDRLQKTERSIVLSDALNLGPRTSVNEADIVALQRIADHVILPDIQSAVAGAMDARSKTGIERLKAAGPIIAALLAATAVVLAAVLR